MSENRLMPGYGEPTIPWRDPEWLPPPKGVKLNILTTGNVALVSDWKDDSNFKAWSPLPKGEPVKTLDPRIEMINHWPNPRPWPKDPQPEDPDSEGGNPD